MALGGGTFVTQNKVLPGSYINFVSADAGINVFGERGTGAIGTSLDWYDGCIHTVTKEDFQKNSLAIFGYDYSDSKVAWARDFFKNGKTLIFGALDRSGEARANNAYCTAKCYGIRGNDLITVIRTNVDNTSLYDVITYLGSTVVDTQIVATASELVDNDFVTFKGDVELQVTAGNALMGGKSGSVKSTHTQDFLTSMESFSFDSITVQSYDDELLVEWTKRMRDEVGKKFQCVVYEHEANYEGCVNVAGDADLLPWVCGALAGCEINKSLSNKVYDGETYPYENLIGDVSRYSQRDLEQFIKTGTFAFHRVGSEIRVLMDINSLTDITEEKGEIFKDNQTIRVCDQIAVDIAEIFNTYYLGKVPNDDAGRTSFWSEIVKHHESLAALRAIENFSSEDITVEQGSGKNSVVVNDVITVVNTMTQLYMTVVVQ